MQEVKMEVNNGLKDRTPTTVDRVLSLHGDCVVETFVIVHTVRLYYPYQTSQNCLQICLLNQLLNCMYYSTFLDTGETEISRTACEILWSQEILYLWRNTRSDPVKREVSLTSRDTQCTRPVNHLTSTWTDTRTQKLLCTEITYF
jgi:hypothetical protein